MTILVFKGRGDLRPDATIATSLWTAVETGPNETSVFFLWADNHEALRQSTFRFKIAIDTFLDFVSDNQPITNLTWIDQR